jgi:hypothetical protein
LNILWLIIESQSIHLLLLPQPATTNNTPNTHLVPSSSQYEEYHVEIADQMILIVQYVISFHLQHMLQVQMPLPTTEQEQETIIQTMQSMQSTFAGGGGSGTTSENNYVLVYVYTHTKVSISYI